ncbi:DASH complex subunit Dam1 [Kalmanozyma brasiliensis GHG001]|uniref:DASH complex subunit DAM1 n=1 Tax=Kalmanozyma brasiliensis (strain GHG001) TaxID=1365824 RepID=V5ET67_KALBG|nr:DASH complex subunit Dam1 [Kalmanozyma brasiliensis GHG001]EST08450.1 DASH complex subunit Dam1 [Kalmanozyma brasiliensis GHG001]
MSRQRTTSGAMPTTPLRRISRGSLNALSHSASKQLSAGATPLSFLQGAMTDLAEEVGVLQLNLENIEAVHESLHSFNENFAMYIYGLKMNAYCVEWPEAPLHDNFERAEKRIAQQAQQYAAQHNLDLAIGSQPYMQHQQQQQQMYNPAADQTYVTTDDESIYRNDAPIAAPAKPALKSALKKPSNAAATAPAKKPATTAAASAAGAAAPKMTLAQKKKREAYTDEIIQTLPLEYRGGGNDPKQNQVAKHVCMALLAAGGKGLKVEAIPKSTEMTQAKIQKTLIALVAAKQVIKASNNGIVYSLDPARHPTLP